MALALVFLAALILYAVTAAPTIVWGDSAMYVLDAVEGAVRAGTASTHPLYIELGRLVVRAPGDPGHSLALLSAVFGAAAVALVFRIGRQLGASAPAAAIGASALAVSHGFWLHAVMPEVYTANAFFLLGTISLLLWWRETGRALTLIAAGLMLLLGLTNHLVLAVVLPAAAVFIVVERRALLRKPMTWAVAGAAVACAGVAVALEYERVAGIVHRIWVGPPGISDYFRLELPISAMMREAALYVGYLGYQFPTISLLLGLLGLRILVRRDRAAAGLLLGIAGLNAAIFIHHTAWASQAKFVFYISDYAIFAVCCALGADWILGRMSPTGVSRTVLPWAVTIGLLTAAVPPALYAAAPRVAASLGLRQATEARLPYRNDAEFFLNPSKRGYDGARRFAVESLTTARPAAVIYADYTPFSVLVFLQRVEGRRPDVALRYQAAPGSLDDRVAVRWEDGAGGRRPIYIASRTLDYYDLSGLTGSYDLVPVGPLLEVRPRE